MHEKKNVVLCLDKKISWFCMYQSWFSYKYSGKQKFHPLSALLPLLLLMKYLIGYSITARLNSLVRCQYLKIKKIDDILDIIKLRWSSWLINPYIKFYVSNRGLILKIWGCPMKMVFSKIGNYYFWRENYLYTHQNC